jgi:uncharacterized repeat protein (TIGR01451 family)
MDAEARINEPFAPQATPAADAADESASTEPTVEEATESSYTPLNTPSSAVQPAGVQGVVGLDVSSPDTIRAGDYITYTYTYTNTGSASVSGVEIELIWANATTSKTTSSSVTQHCPAAPDPIIANCGLLTDSVQGPAVTVIRGAAMDGTSVKMRVQLGAFAAGQNGRFSVRLRSNANKFPKTAEPVTRPASSAQLFLSGQGTPTSEDTANTMIIGPVFVLTKTPTTTGKVYPVKDTAEFVIRIGNATAPGDIVGGQRRPDATNATNVILNDTVPLGAELVSATPSGTVTSSTITWTIPSLAVGEVREFTVVFRKLDNNVSCDRVSNRTYNVTSDQMPLNGTTRYTVTGDTANIDIATPLVVKSITPTPSSVVFGNEATIAIVVQNFWDQDLNGVQLHYDIQSNASYIIGTANPAAASSPTPGQFGGRISWTFSIGAGNKTTPIEKTFSLKVRGGYTTIGTGTAQIVPPAGVPAGCIKTKNGQVKLQPRLVATKNTDADPDTKIGKVYIVNRGQEFSYYIDITNNGVADAPGVDVSDRLPGEWGANFAYIEGSSRLNGQLHNPDSVVNGPGGSLIWNDLYVPAGSTIRLSYRLQVNGYYYVDYCNSIDVSNDSETVEYGNREVCVKINPQIEVTKTASKSSGGPGEEIQFTLTLTNRESSTFRVGLFDYLDKFVFVRQVSGYAQPTYNAADATLAWPLVDLPAGQQLQAVIVAKLPDPCAATSYENEVLFQAVIGPGTEAVVQPIPRVKAKVTCARLEYSKSVDRATISLGDRHMYTLTVKNADPAGPISNVVVDDMLPQGFSFVGMDALSGVKTSPTQSTRADGRTKLSWAITSIAANSIATVKFIATAGSVVGNHTNWMVASVDGVPGTCKSACVTENDTGIVFSTKAVSVQAMITIEPSIVQTACAKPGEVRTYRLTVVNTNTHAYANTTITGTLPFGLSYVKTVGTSPVPRVSTDAAGVTKLTWLNQTIPAKPANTFGSQLILEVEVAVGQVWGELVTVEQATSPDGLIPRKDGVQNAAVVVCPAQPAIAKDVNRHIVRIGDEVRYMISLANTNITDLNVTVEDQLPANISYLGPVSGGTPTVNGRTLSWNVTIPKVANGKPGSTLIVFRARVDSGSPGTRYTNTATITAGGSGFDTTKNATTIVVANAVLYFPVLQY